MKQLILEHILKTAQPIIRLIPLEKQRCGQREILKHKPLSQSVSFVEDRHLDFNAEWVVPEKHRSDYAILYIHGGGYGMGDLLSSRALIAPIAECLGIAAFSFEYRLAPEYPYPAALEDCITAYQYMLSQGFAANKIIFVGDSAGGGLVLALTLKIRKTFGKPCCLVTLSPWADLTQTSLSYRIHEKDDPMLSANCLNMLAQAYIGENSPLNPYISPAFAKYDADFPPTLIQVGTHEVLFDDAKNLHNHLRKSGVHSELQIYRNMWHIFHIWNIKQSAAAIKNIADFVSPFVSYSTDKKRGAAYGKRK